MMINSREAVREAVVRGLGIAPVAEFEFIPDKRLHTVRVSNADMKNSVYVCCLKRRIQRQRISAFLNLVERGKFEEEDRLEGKGAGLKLNNAFVGFRKRGR